MGLRKLCSPDRTASLVWGASLTGRSSVRRTWLGLMFRHFTLRPCIPVCWCIGPPNAGMSYAVVPAALHSYCLAVDALVCSIAHWCHSCVPSCALMQVTPLQALVLGLSKIPIQVRLWHVLGAQYDTAHAVRRAVLLNGLTFVTTVTVQMYLRLLYERHAAKLRREKQERSS